MFFYYGEKERELDVKKAFENVRDDDYMDTLDAFGVAVHIPGDSDFNNFSVYLMLNNKGDKVSIEIYDDEDCEIIKDLKITQEEFEVIRQYLKI